MNRSTLATLGLGLALAAGACGRYGPPVRTLAGRRPGAPSLPPRPPLPTPTMSPANPGDTIETFEDEPTP